MGTISDLDFSPDSTRLVSADGVNTATVWDLATSEKVHMLEHCKFVEAAKYSPQGDRIATASRESLLVWDSDDGRLLVEVKMELKLRRGLLWLNNHLFVITKDSNIEQIDATTGSTLSKWSVPDDANYSCISLPQHGKFMAYSTKNNITFWNTSTHSRIGCISHCHDTYMQISPAGKLLAVATMKNEVIIEKLSSIIQEPEIHVDSLVLDLWKQGQITKAEELLTATIQTSRNTAHIFTSRALVRARLRQWNTALVDAEESIKTRSSALGYVAKFVALVGKGEMRKAGRLCDIALSLFHSDQVTLLLIKAVVLFMAGGYDDAISRIDDLIRVVGLNSALDVVQAYMFFLVGNMYMESGGYDRAIQSFEYARAKLGDNTDQLLLIVSLISGWDFDNLAITIQRLCEALFAAGRTREAAESVLRAVRREADIAEPLEIWATDFMRRCLSAPGNCNVSRDVLRPNNISICQKTSSVIMSLSREWVKLRLKTVSWKDALTAATGFILPAFKIYQVISERLEVTGHIVDAVSCFHKMCSREIQGINSEQARWCRDFKSRCRIKLENLGDSNMNDREHDEAILQYTTALSLEPAAPQDLLCKRSKAHAAKGEWQNALKDANHVIKLYPPSPWGYERKHAALHAVGRCDDAIDISGYWNHAIRGLVRSRQYIKPEETRKMIRTMIKNTVRDFPTVLIHTISGRLCDKTEQAAAFESMPIFTELVSSMTTCIDHALIESEVGKYYRYATFSHTWQDNEPQFDKVSTVLVYELEESPTHHKLKMFCKIAREAGFYWAWSDTCCIDKKNHFILQESLVSMFQWYQYSSMTIIFLLGIDRLADFGAMVKSLWNMRGWTLQEYHASKVVRFYTEDWTPYLGVDIYNHKDSPQIIREMEEATGISAQALMALRPGLDDVREKLRLASTRQTTRVEDAAYSLLGIFSMSIPITYGEGDRALGHLLAQLLTSSGETSILAWTGRSGSFNSCLPASITAFGQLLTSHIPPAIPDGEMAAITTILRSLVPSSVTELYDKLNMLSVPSFSGCRMKLPCLIFKLGRVSTSLNASERVFRAKATALRIVEIRTEEDLSRLDSLYLVHPWIDFLLDRQPVGSIGNVAETITKETIRDESSILGGLVSVPGPASDTVSLWPPSTVSPAQKRACVLQFIARLRRPFGALLLTPTRSHMEEYRRIAAESLIKVRIEELTPEIVDKLIQSVQTLDVL